MVTNADHTNGNSSIAIRGCDIDGNLTRGGYRRGLMNFRTGVYLEKVSTAEILDTWIHDTHHSCIYVRNHDGLVRARGLLLEYCGGWEEERLLRGQGLPALYVFASGRDAVTRGVVLEDSLVRFSHVGFNTRKEDARDLIKDLSFRNSRFEDSGWCFNLRGSERVRIEGVDCVRTLGWQLLGGVAFDELTANNRDVIVSDVGVFDVVDQNEGEAIYVGPYNADVRLRRVALRGIDGFMDGEVELPAFDQSGVRIELPQRGFSAAKVDLCDVPGSAMHIAGEPLDQRDRRERLEFRSLLIDGVDVNHIEGDAFVPDIHVESESAALSISKLRIRRSGGWRAIEVASSAARPAADWKVSAGLDMAPSWWLDNYAGTSSESELPACGRATQGAIYSLSAGRCPEGSGSLCQCTRNGGWRDLRLPVSVWGVDFASGQPGTDASGESHRLRIRCENILADGDAGGRDAGCVRFDGGRQLKPKRIRVRLNPDEAAAGFPRRGGTPCALALGDRCL